MRRKLYSSRRVKEEGTVYVPIKPWEQQPAIVCLLNPNLLRVQKLIEKYKLQTT